MFKDYNSSKKCEECGSEFFRDKRNTWAYWEAAKFCSRQCSSIHGVKVKLQKTPTIQDAFWRKAIVGNPDECWEWSGYGDKDGYPLLSFRGKSYRANRIALLIKGYDLKDDKHACHSCGNKSCCNPDHIYQGSPKENNYDKRHHGTHKCGEQIHSAKLTEENVLEIRELKGTNKYIGDKYGISPSNVSHIKSRKTWKHLA